MQQEESKNKKLKDIVNLFSFAILCFGQVFAQPNEVYATFEVQALQRATLALSANGVVEEIFVEVGAQVKKEKLLALKVKDVKENVQIARANLEVVEGKVTDKIEGAISGIESLKKITSTSVDSVSVVVVEFELEKDIEIAANDVRNKVSTLSFGSEIQSPMIEKFNVGGALTISLFVSPRTKIENTQELLELNVHTGLNQTSFAENKGVDKVNLVGYLEREIKVLPFPNALNKYNLTFTDIVRAINAQNIEIDGGRLISKEKEWKLITKADASNVQDLGNLLIGEGIKLSDIALIVDSVKEQRSFSHLITKETSGSGISLEVQKITGANEIEIADSIKEILPFCKKLAHNTSSHLCVNGCNYPRNRDYY